jgi:carbon monoxide dehydrogenase subunit G
MELKGEVTITAPRDRVWAALNDPDVLARCIEGVETLTRVTGADGERFEGKMNAKVGPVRATFTGQVTLADVVPPESYRLVGEGKGGVAGFAKGEAAVSLAEIPAGTLLSYHVTSSVGGKLAQLGARLIEGTARGLAESFFTKLKDEVEAPAPVMAPADSIASDIRAETPPAPADAATTPGIEYDIPTPTAAPAPVMPPATGLSPWIWGGALIAGVLVFLLWQWGI